MRAGFPIWETPGRSCDPSTDSAGIHDVLNREINRLYRPIPRLHGFAGDDLFAVGHGRERCGLLAFRRHFDSIDERIVLDRREV
jgi:hypothetical protein